MVQSIKDIRSTAVEVLKIMSAELIAWGDREANAEQRKAFVDATASLQQSTTARAKRCHHLIYIDTHTDRA
jgi:hypothetical protein